MNAAGPVAFSLIALPQLPVQLAGADGGAQTRWTTSQRTPEALSAQSTLLPETVKLCSASAGCLEGMNAPPGTSGATAVVTVWVTVCWTVCTTVRTGACLTVVTVLVRTVGFGVVVGLAV